MISPEELAEIERGAKRVEKRAAFSQAIGYLNLCLGRMRACREEHPEAHVVSVGELPRWIKYLELVLENWEE